jgi:Uma2 family endonuclease
MAVPATALTLEQFLSIADRKPYCELVDGRAIPKSVSPKYFHSALQVAILELLKPWAKNRGRVLPEFSVVLKRGGRDWVPIPDVAFISYDRLPREWKRNEACPVPPDLAVEIVSPDQTMKTLESKAGDYLAAGVDRVWVVEPEERFVAVFAPDTEKRVLTGTETLADDRFPDVKLTPKRIFQKAEL